MRVEQAIDGESSPACSSKTRRQRFHPQHRELRRTHGGMTPSPTPTVEHEGRGLRLVRGPDVDQAGFGHT